MERGIYAAPVDELAGVGLNLHALVIQEEIDKCFSGVGPRRFGFEADVVPVTEHVVVANVIEIGALFVVGQDKTGETYADGRFATAYPFGGGDGVLNENRFCSGEIVDEFLGACFGHNLSRLASH